MSRSPSGRRRFNDYRPLPPPSPQAKSERANAARFADVLLLQEEVAATPNGTPAPQVVLHNNRSPSSIDVSPRRDGVSGGREDAMSGVRLHSRAASDDRARHVHSAPRPLYHDTADSGLTGALQNTEDQRTPYGSGVKALASQRYTSAPRADAGMPLRASAHPPTVHDESAYAGAPPYSSHATYNRRNSPPARSRSRSVSQSKRQRPARQPVLETPGNKDAQRPPGYRSYARDTFNSRQSRTQKHNTDDDILACVLQRRPWNPNTTPTHRVNPLHWAIGDDEHCGNALGGIDDGANETGVQRNCRRVSAERQQSAPRRDDILDDPAGQRPRRRRASSAVVASTSSSRRWREPPMPSSSTPQLVGSGYAQQTEAHDVSTCSPYQSPAAQLLEEILTEVERLRVEAKQQRRQLRECRRREKSYLLHIQALERVLQRRVPDGEAARTAGYGTAADVGASTGVGSGPQRNPAQRRPQPTHPSQVYPPVTDAADLSANSTLYSLGLSPVPRASAQPLPSTNVSANIAGVPPPPAETTPYPSHQRHGQRGAQPHAERQAAPVGPVAAPLGHRVGSLLEKLNDLKSIERQLRDELHQAFSRVQVACQPHDLSLQAEMEREELVLDDVALHHRRHEQQRHQALAPRRVDERGSSASLHAQYGPPPPPTAFMHAWSGQPAQQGPCQEPQTLAAGDLDPEPARRISGDYAARVHHSHHVRPEQDPDKDYTLGVQGDPVCMTSAAERVPPPRQQWQHPQGQEQSIPPRTVKNDRMNDESDEAAHLLSRTTPPPPLSATVAALREDILADVAVDAEADEVNPAEAARRERARERALLIQSLEVSSTKCNAHLHDVQKNFARPRPQQVDVVPPLPSHTNVEGTNETVSDAGSDAHPVRAISEHQVWGSFQDDDELDA